MAEFPDNYFRKIDFTLQAGCPVRCDFCPQTLFLKEYKSPEKKITMDNFKLALSNLKNSSVKTIQFAGFSEPLYHKNFYDFVVLSVEAGFEVLVISTLKGLDTERLKNIKNLPVIWEVSIQPINMQNRKGLNDEEAWNNIKSFMKLNFKFQPIFRCLDLNLSVEERNRLIMQGKELGIKNIVFGEFNTRAGIIAENQINKFGKKIICGYNIPPEILPNGDVLLCCMDFGVKHKIGNIFKESFEKILSSDSLKKIINTMSLKEEGKILCHTCEAAIPMRKIVPSICYAKTREMIYHNLITDNFLPLGSSRREKVKYILKKLGILYGFKSKN